MYRLNKQLIYSNKNVLIRTFQRKEIVRKLLEKLHKSYSVMNIRKTKMRTTENDASTFFTVVEVDHNSCQ